MRTLAHRACLLDRLRPVRSSSGMNRGRTLLLIVVLTTCHAIAQQPAAKVATPATNSAPARYDTSLSSLLTTDLDSSRDDVITGKSFQVSGPLVRPLKANKIWNVPLRLLQLGNPFAPPEPKADLERVGNLSPRAWSTVVGWHPGASSWPDPITHEPKMSLISVSGKRQP